MSDMPLYESCYRRVVIAAYAVTGELDRAGELATRVFTGVPDSEETARARVLRLARRDRRLRRRTGTGETPPLPDRCAGLLALIDELPAPQRTTAVLHHLGGAPVDESTVDNERLAEADAALGEATGLPAARLAEELAELRELLTESIRQPDLFEVRASARERRSGTRVKVGAVLAVLAVAAAVPVLRGTRPADTADTASGVLSHADPYGRSILGGNQDGSQDGPFVYGLDFADQTHGYALRGVCVILPSRRCTDQLLTTTDGQHWRIHRIPQGATSSLGARLVVLGVDRIVVEDFSQNIGTPTRRFSADGGLTWQVVPAAVEGLIAAIPRGGAVEAPCTDPAQSTDSCPHKLLTVIDPATGRSALLANQPELDVRWAANVPDRDGVWWVSGKDPASGKPALSASRDGGRSWTFSVLDDAPDSTPGPMVQAGPGVLYATTASPGDGGLVLTSIHRSVDAGVTWQRTWQATAGVEPPAVPGAPIVTDRGNLLVISNTGRPYRSTDGGATFQPFDGVRGLYWVVPVHGGYLSISQDGLVYQHSTDGENWTTITPPLR